MSAAWHNRGDVTIRASDATSPSLIAERYGSVGIGGVLRTAPLLEDSPVLGPSVRMLAWDTSALYTTGEITVVPAG